MSSASFEHQPANTVTNSSTPCPGNPIISLIHSSIHFPVNPLNRPVPRPFTHSSITAPALSPQHLATIDPSTSHPPSRNYSFLRPLTSISVGQLTYQSVCSTTYLSLSIYSTHFYAYSSRLSSLLCALPTKDTIREDKCGYEEIMPQPEPLEVRPSPAIPDNLTAPIFFDQAARDRRIIAGGKTEFDFGITLALLTTSGILSKVSKKSDYSLS
ncbi:unnamed protein product [Protopolystoma xenopodis]|uniref:Uncharacterized protein n=1 Tax=Protopolystoma xenopodis TaxID=117903 RepID=A0A3S5ALQ2_9PLAT|nr:unnamed protein product [Protopolystoma xenopodis]